YTFENNPQGKFMLAVFLGQSKYYVDSLSENIKRGNRAKVEKGWRPSQAPIGYRNCKETGTIIIDPERFPLIRKLFEYLLTEAYSPRQVHDLARDEWGLRTPKHKKIGGKPLSLSAIYRILNNPFYAGVLRWNGQTYPSKHVPVVTLDEFERVQRMLHRPTQARPHEKNFAFTGTIRCGNCGLLVTAEDKVNRHGKRYVYYHCTRRNAAPPYCREKAVQVGNLEDQIVSFLERIMIPEPLHGFALEQIAATRLSREETVAVQMGALERAHADITKRIDTLTDLRIRDLIGDDEFGKKRAALQEEQLKLRDRLERSKGFDTFEPLADFFYFSSRAVDWFQAGDMETKRMIFKTTGSNPTLTDKILNVQARKPFCERPESLDVRQMRRIINDILTLHDDLDFAQVLANIRFLIRKHEPGGADRKAA
ncbi:MAG TPA: recombinase family protein, partial [Rhodomicrobium sp.]|nr:recombinase family protein [Rhodomicrobium sp.]